MGTHRFSGFADRINSPVSVRNATYLKRKKVQYSSYLPHHLFTSTIPNIKICFFQVNPYGSKTFGVCLEINLASPQPEDAHLWLQVRSQKSTQENNPIGILSVETLRQQILDSNSEITKRKTVHRYFIYTSQPDFAGVISLKDIHWDSGVCELGYLIAEKYQNKGVATQAVALIMQKAFSAGIRKIKATTFVNNVGSYKVLQKNGFVLEGLLKNEVLIQGHLQDMYSWAAYSSGAIKTDENLFSDIRSAKVADWTFIHKLSHQLGYSPSEKEAQDHLAQILIHPDYEVVVIERNADILGWMTLYKKLRLEDVAFLQVAALVTDKKYRNQGLGSTLMNYAETRARSMKLPFVGLHSGKPRSDAHRFYESIGYAKHKESYFFKKELNPSNKL